MKYLAIQAVIVRGSRIERGQEVEIDQALAESIGPHLLAPVQSVEDVKPEPVPEVKDYSEMNRAELIEEAKAQGLATNGTKAELLERLTLAKK